MLLPGQTTLVSQAFASRRIDFLQSFTSECEQILVLEIIPVPQETLQDVQELHGSRGGSKKCIYRTFDNN